MANRRFKPKVKGVKAATRAANKVIKQVGKVPGHMITGIEIIIKTARKPFKKRRS